MSGKSFLGLNERVAAALAYVFSFVSGAFFLVLEKENKYVRFHALQSILLFGIFGSLSFVLGILTRIIFLFGILNSFVSLLFFVSSVYLAYSAYQGKTVRYPIIGDVIWNKVYK